MRGARRVLTGGGGTAVEVLQVLLREKDITSDNRR